MTMTDIDLSEYNYILPIDRIAQYPVEKRDQSRLLICRGDNISDDIFANIPAYLPKDSLLVFNNTKVIRARILFRKDTGAGIEVLCLEPLNPSDYQTALGSMKPVEWKCIIGNLKKWKEGVLSTTFIYNGINYRLNAEKSVAVGDAWRIRFTWDCDHLNFGEVIEAIGHVPLPPYITRADELEDSTRYQTVYSSVKGSVAAPTAGLHFTMPLLEKLKSAGIAITEVTLHVGAGTFKPVKSRYISGHTMHAEHFFLTSGTIRTLIGAKENLIAVGTTSVRTLESLYWLGVKVLSNAYSDRAILSLEQWEPYELSSETSVTESLNALLEFLEKNDLTTLHASTSMIIVPGYKFRMINGLITNFHQPASTLLLLVSAWIGERWKKAYNYALNNDFRFLSYGDSSLFLR